MIYARINNDIDTAKTIMSPRQEVCFIEDRDNDMVYLVTTGEYWGFVRDNLSVAASAPLTDDAKNYLRNIDNVVYSGATELIDL